MNFPKLDYALNKCPGMSLQILSVFTASLETPLVVENM